MLIFNCTAAATEFFTTTRLGKKVTVVETPPGKTLEQSETTPPRGIWQWFIHAIKIDRKTILIVMDYQSRYAMVFTGLKKGGDIDFMNQFEHHLITHSQLLMTEMKSSETLMDKSIDNYMAQHDDVVFYKRGDRSVQQHINDVAWYVERTIDLAGGVFPEGIELIDLDDMINKTVRSIKKENRYFYPINEFFADWLNYYVQLSPSQIKRILNTYHKFKGYVFDESLDDLTLADLSPHDLASEKNSAPKRKDNNVVSLDSFRKSKR